MRNQNGFTLIEILLVVSLTAILAVGGAIFASRVISFREFDRTVGLIRTQLVTAENYAKGGTNDSAWGVSFLSHGMTSFAGSSFATRNTAYDQVTLFSNGVTLSGISSIVFTQPFGLPTLPGVVTVSDGILTDTISVNSQGIVEVVRVTP